MGNSLDHAYCLLWLCAASQKSTIKIAACAAGRKDKMVLGDRPEYKAAAQIVACVKGANSLVAICSDFLVKDPKTRAVLACAAQAGGLFQARTRGLGQSPTSVSARRCETLPG